MKSELDLLRIMHADIDMLAATVLLCGPGEAWSPGPCRATGSQQARGPGEAWGSGAQGQRPQGWIGREASKGRPNERGLGQEKERAVLRAQNLPSGEALGWTNCRPRTGLGSGTGLRLSN